MTEQELKETFAQYITEAKKDGWDNHVKIYPFQWVSIENFLKIFGTVSLNHADLTKFDGGNLGYSLFFDQAKTDGYLM
jgi:hypothetical protein